MRLDSAGGDLRARTCVVTGAGSGIGRAAALALT
jgi:NAD(P)-dependent dehydrogenase (short-subunit alcohol dehydrogenase family)